MGIATETVFISISCKCGAGPFEDREAWVEHVRQNMPIPSSRRSKRPDFRKQEVEQLVMTDYISSHGIRGILPEENHEKEHGTI